MLDEFPRLGVSWHHPELPNDLDIRRLPLRAFPFVIIYGGEPDPVVIAVAHGHREPEYWTTRIGEDPGHR